MYIAGYARHPIRNTASRCPDVPNPDCVETSTKRVQVALLVSLACRLISARRMVDRFSPAPSLSLSVSLSALVVFWQYSSLGPASHSSAFKSSVRILLPSLSPALSLCVCLSLSESGRLMATSESRLSFRFVRLQRNLYSLSLSLSLSAPGRL